MRKETSLFYKKYCRVVGGNIIMEEIKTKEDVKYVCSKGDICPNENCHIKHLLIYNQSKI